MSNLPLTPYQRIMRAYARGMGCRLSAEDVRRLAKDAAIVTVAADDEERAKAQEDPEYEPCFVRGEP